MDQSTCTVPDCPKPPKKRMRLCSAHVARLARTGSLGTAPVVSHRTEPDPCKLDGCDGNTKGGAKGYCQRCYSRFRKTGSAETPLRSLSAQARFQARVIYGEGCWEWSAAHNPKSGYAVMRVDGTLRYAHRLSYELHVGPIPDGLVIDHLCMNRGCVNPAHLEPVTQGENTRRAARARRHA